MNAKQREQLWDRECDNARDRGRGDYPICNLCDLPVQPGQSWDESHVGRPKALGGTETGIAHRRCNRHHGAKHVVPFVAKAKRMRRKFIGAGVPPARPLPGTKASGIAKPFAGEPYWRDSGRPLRAGR